MTQDDQPADQRPPETGAPTSAPTGTPTPIPRPGASVPGAPGDSRSRDQIASDFIEALPHVRALGMRVTSFGDGKAEMELDWRPELVGDPRTGVIHGGVVSALMDTCSGAAVLAAPEQARSTATIDLRIDYMRSATPGQKVRARAECFHVTRSVAFVRAVTLDDDETRPVATATGAFTMER